MTSIAFIGMVLTAIACNRVASQKNFLGASCRDQSECPSDLTCRDGFCRAFCSAGAKCPTPGDECINGACVPPQTSSNGTDGPGVSAGSDGGTDKPSTGFDGSVQQEPPGGAPGNGTPVRSGIVADMGIGFSFFVDDSASKLFYVATEMDQFTGQKTFIYEAGFGSSPATKMTELTGIGGAERTKIHVANGYVYFIEQSSLQRIPVGSTNKTKVLDMTGGMSPQDWNAPGGKFVFQDAQQRVRIYDMNTGTVDATIYETLTQDELQGGAVVGTTVYWSVLEKSINSQTVFRKGTVGSTTFTKPYTLSGGVMNIRGFAATSQAIAFLAGNPTALASLDAAHPGPTPNVLLNNVANNHGGTAPPVDGAFAYVAKQKTGSGVTPIMKVNMEDGTSTEVGQIGEETPESSIIVAGPNIYWTEEVRDMTSGDTTVTVVSRPK